MFIDIWDRRTRLDVTRKAQNFLDGVTSEAFSWYSYENKRPSIFSPFDTRCAESTDCGQGYFCSSGFCRQVGAGNTGSAPEGGCSVGPNENAGVSTQSCGGQSGTGNLGKCGCPGCGYGSVNNCGGNRCCRYTSYSIQCYCGSCPCITCGKGQACSSWCSTHLSSYGALGSGCSTSNSCSECAACVDGRCQKLEENVPCHCDPSGDDNCNRPGVPLTCCTYKDTCEGRIYLPPGQTYCHDTYRTYWPRCYDPNHTSEKCNPPEPDSCIASCENFTHTQLSGDPPWSPPAGCNVTGTIQNDETGDQKILYQCCDSSDCDDDGSFDPFNPDYVWVRMVYQRFNKDGNPIESQKGIRRRLADIKDIRMHTNQVAGTDDYGRQIPRGSWVVNAEVYQSNAATGGIFVLCPTTYFKDGTVALSDDCMVAGLLGGPGLIAYSVGYYQFEDANGNVLKTWGGADTDDPNWNT